MRVVIADDDAVVVESLRIVLDAQPDIEVAGCGTDGADAVRLAAEAAPDVVLLDIQMPGVDGLAAAEQILAASQPPRVVFLTTFSDDEYIVRALSLGAAGYLIKQDVAGVAPALRAVMAGRSVLEGEVLERAVALGAGGAAGASGATAEKPDLATLPAAHRPRARGRGAHRRGPRQPRGGRGRLHGRGHHPQPHQLDPGQAAPAQPHADRRGILEGAQMNPSPITREGVQ